MPAVPENIFDRINLRNAKRRNTFVAEDLMKINEALVKLIEILKSEDSLKNVKSVYSIIEGINIKLHGCMTRLSNNFKYANAEEFMRIIKGEDNGY